MRVERRAARAILIDDAGRLVVFKRTVPKRKVYWSTPGGGVDPEDSSVEAALHRELAEELGAVVDRVQQVFITSPPRGDGIAIQHFFVCRLVSMDLKARTGAEFSNPAKGRYDVERIDLHGKKLARYDLQPREARDFILTNRMALLSAALDDDVPPLTDPAPPPATEDETAIGTAPERATPETGPASVGAPGGDGADGAAKDEVATGEVASPDVPTDGVVAADGVPAANLPAPRVHASMSHRTSLRETQQPEVQLPSKQPTVNAGVGATQPASAVEQGGTRRRPRRSASQLLEVVATAPPDASAPPPPPRRRRALFRRR